MNHQLLQAAEELLGAYGSFWPSTISLLHWILQGVLLLWQLILFILMACGMQGMANRRGLTGAWLSWLPVGRLWVLGSLSDHYQRAAKGRAKRKRRALLSIVFAGILAAVLLTILLYTFLFLSYQVGKGRYVDDASMAVLGVAIALLSGLLGVLILSHWILRQMALFDVYRASRPRQAVLFLILGLLFPFLPAFFVIACRNRDLGLPTQLQTAETLA